MNLQLTTGPAAPPAVFVMGSNAQRRPDPVRARVHAEPQTTNAELLQIDLCRHPGATATPAVPLLPPDAHGGPRKPHPGDVLYWVACLGGACLLLLAAIT